MSAFADTPKPPYYAVIFSSRRSPGDNGYEITAERMLEIATRQPGFLGVESVRDNAGFGITVSYWATVKSIAAWKADVEHRAAQEMGKRAWYEHYTVKVAKVERAYGIPAVGHCAAGSGNDREFSLSIGGRNKSNRSFR